MFLYKIRMAYNDDTEDIYVTEKQLQHAYYAFLTESRIVLPTGEALRGKDIISITPDMVRCMGWNQGYVPTPEDWGDIKRVLGEKPRELAERQKLIAEHIISENRPDLLGKDEREQLVLGETQNNILSGFSLKKV